MARRGKARKAKAKDPITEHKKIQLQKQWDLFQSLCEEYETHLNTICNQICDKIRKMYTDKLNSLPENVRNMTMSEYMEMQKKLEETHDNKFDDYRSEFEKSKLMSEKKKTLKKNKIERKRSLSASVSNVSLVNPTLLSRTSRILSDSCISTPLSKRSIVPSFVVTPKFNPRVPITKTHMRRPRVGEVLMSLSGSPLQNTVDETLDKPGVSLSLGGGKVYKITDDTEIAKLESEFVKILDDNTKQTLENVKKQLDKILQCGATK